MQPRSLRTWMVWLPLVLLLTCVGLGSLSVYRVWGGQSVLLQEQLRSEALTTANALERQFQQTIAMLRALAAALPAEPASARAELHARAQALLTGETGLQDVMLQDAQGREIWSARQAYARDMVPADAGTSSTGLGIGTRLQADAQARLSDLPASPSGSTGAAPGLPGAPSFEVPVRVGGVPHLIVATLDTAALGKGIAPAALGEFAVSGLLDRQQRFVTRSIDSAKWFGRAPSEGWKAAMAASPSSGVARFATHEGIESHTGWAVLPAFGWTYGIAMPARHWDRAAWTSLAGFLGALALMALAGAAFMRRLTRHMVRATDQLSQTAAALAGAGAGAAGVGEDAAHFNGPITEFNLIGQDLSRSAALLHQQHLARENFEASQAASLVREKAARQSAEQASRAKDEFMASLGHELRNPVAAIVNAAAVLQRLPEGDGRAGALHQIVERQGRNLARMVDDLMDMGRLLGDKVQIEPTRVDLHTVAAHAVEMLREAGQLAQHELRLEGQAAFVHGDASRLEQAVTNLVSNAARYTPPGGHISVKVAPGNGGLNAVVRVSDDGVGIRQDMLENIFELFVQGEAGARKVGKGLGVGLAVVRRIAALHGGTVRAQSEGEGRGAVFELTIPLATDGALPTAAPVAPRIGRYEALRVLIVDDNEDLRESMRQLLQLSGCEVNTAGDGPGGVATGLSFEPALALIDIGLPGFDGVNVAARLREAFAQRIHLVAVSGFDMRDSAPPGVFDATLLKPITEDALEEQLRAAASRRA